MNKIFLFTDYRGQFYSSTKHRGAAVDLKRLKKYFEEFDVELVAIPFAKLDFRTQNYRNQWVLYQSSEDPGLFYKSYIEDIILGLFIQGARLIPGLPQFRAHHNKHFMEIMRDLHSSPNIKNIKAERYGTYEDYLKELNKLESKSFVLKSSNTSKSKGVFLLESTKQKIKLPKDAAMYSAIHERIFGKPLTEDQRENIFRASAPVQEYLAQAPGWKEVAPQ